MVTQQEYLRASFNLPNGKEGDTVEVICNSITGKKIKFEWNKEGNGWEMLDSIISPPRNGRLMLWCRKDAKSVEHIINKNADKVKCTCCGTITEIKL